MMTLARRGTLTLAALIIGGSVGAAQDQQSKATDAIDAGPTIELLQRQVEELQRQLAIVKEQLFELQAKRAEEELQLQAERLRHAAVAAAGVKETDQSQSEQVVPSPVPQSTIAPQTVAGTPPQQASNLLNPNISLVGNLIAAAGGERALPDQAFQLSEAELGIQAPIDPFARADVFVAVGTDGAKVEEAYVTWLTLPGSLTLKGGRFRSNLGKFNRTHPPETPFVDRPLATERFFGEEGLTATGFSVSWLVPASFYLNVDAEMTTNWQDAPLFGDEGADGEIEAGGDRSNLGYLLRASTYHDFSEQINGSFGLSWMRCVHDPEGELESEAAALDATVRWKDPRRAIYRSFTWQTEAYFTRRSEVGGDTDVWGGFSCAEYQFGRRWRSGLRADYVEAPKEKGLLAYLTFWPSEFSGLSLQGRFVRRPDGRGDAAAFFRLTFNIGPHGAHPF